MTPAIQLQYIIPETVFNHVVAALRDNRQYDVAEYLIHGATPAAPAEQRANIHYDMTGSDPTVTLKEMRDAITQFPYCAPCDNDHQDCNKCLAEHDAAIRKAEREQAKKMYSLMMCVKKENTDEFMEYYESRMHEFEESLRGGGA